ncbi:transcription elongation factor GreA [Paraburkholderia sediminicola]|nr:transcription elongation factor GreA [Paraburkholderia sediminicola]
MMEYVNVPHTIGFAITGGLATPHELQTVYGTEDLWDLIEVQAVNGYNEAQRARRHP